MSISNQIKTVLLLGMLTGLLLGIGYMFGGQSGLLIALVFSFLFNFGAYWFSDRQQMHLQLAGIPIMRQLHALMAL